MLSVTVPTLNEERYVARALRSLLDDPFVRDNRDRVEVLLVDSGSDDATVDVARPFVDRVVRVGWGKLRARNAGVRAARAPIVAWMDADVEVPPGSVESMMRHFDDPDTVAVGSYTRYARPFIDALRRIPDAAAPLVGNLNGRFGAVRREVFERIGGFDESRDCRNLARMILTEQVGLGWRLAREGRVVWDPQVVHVHSDRRILRADAAYARGLGVERF